MITLAVTNEFCAKFETGMKYANLAILPEEQSHIDEIEVDLYGNPVNFTDSFAMFAVERYNTRKGKGLEQCQCVAPGVDSSDPRVKAIYTAILSAAEAKLRGEATARLRSEILLLKEEVFACKKEAKAKQNDLREASRRLNKVERKLALSNDVFEKQQQVRDYSCIVFAPKMKAVRDVRRRSSKDVKERNRIWQVESSVLPLFTLNSFYSIARLKDTKTIATEYDEKFQVVSAEVDAIMAPAMASVASLNAHDDIKALVSFVVAPKPVSDSMKALALLKQGALEPRPTWDSAVQSLIWGDAVGYHITGERLLSSPYCISPTSVCLCYSH